jgi:hypothetical protein
MSELQVPLFADLTDQDCEGGACPVCGSRARLMSCWECCDTAWVVGCSHRSDSPPMRRGRRDGSDPTRVFCSECADVLVEPDDAD